MRTFIAIDIPAEIRDRIKELITALKTAGSGVRWARPDGLHVTLKFLGEVAPAKVEDVKRALAGVPAQEPLSIRIRGAGFFPGERAPRVMWLGIEADGNLGRLAGIIEEKTLAIGFAKEDRPFSPHLTLGRVQTHDTLTGVRQVLRDGAPLDFGSFEARAFYLYESKPSPSGSVYTKLERFEIAPDPGRNRQWPIYLTNDS